MSYPHNNEKSHNVAKKRRKKPAMSSRTRILWIQWHAYMSCFFLPLALVYVVSGVLYLFDIEGGPEETRTINILLTVAQLENYPANDEQARQFVKAFYPEALPEFYYQISESQGWWDLNQVIILTTPENGRTSLIIEENDIWRQLLYIHKGIVGDLFKVLGILLGISLFFSLVSGVVVALAMPKMKRPAMQWLLAGSITLIISFWLVP